MEDDARMDTMDEVLDTLSRVLIDAAGRWASTDTVSDRLDAQDLLRTFAAAHALAFARSLAVFEKKQGGGVTLNDDAIIDQWGESLRTALAISRGEAKEIFRRH